jgi:hypothetical protein
MLPLAAELKQTVSDTNLLKLAFMFESQGQGDCSGLVCLCSYINKLESALFAISYAERLDVHKITHDVYWLIERDTL